MSFVFVSGNLALDFAGTLKWRRGDPEELLREPADLARWAVEAGVVTEEPSADAAALRRARELRELIYRLVLHAMDGADGVGGAGGGRPWPDDDVRALNAVAGGGAPRVTLTPAGLVRAGDAEAVAGDIARSAIALLGGFAESRVRECGRSECTRIFVDRSRAGNRQWCGMEECGNRVKAANYRSRRSATASRPRGAARRG